MAFEFRLPTTQQSIIDGIAASVRDVPEGFDASFQHVSDEIAASVQHVSDEIAISVQHVSALIPDGLGRAVEALFGPDPFAGLDDGIGLGDLASLADRLPPELAGPDATGQVPTGAADITREEAFVSAALSASARIVRAIGPEAETVAVDGRSFAVLDRYDDPATGFDAIHLRALDGGGEDVFAIDGLEVGSAQDTLAALTLAETQARSPEFQRLVADAVDASLTEGRMLEVVGPSLGGALAQVAAYGAAESLIAAGAAPGTGTIRLVTVDALGGRDAAEAVAGGTLDPAALAAIDALNLRTEGDIVSRIGSHIGESISFQPVDSAGEPVQLSPEQAHVNGESLLATLRSDTLFDAGTRGAPAEIGGLARLSDLAADRFVEAVSGTGLLAAGEGDLPLQAPGTARFDDAGTTWMLDADQDGQWDIVVGLSAMPADTSDLVFG